MLHERNVLGFVFVAFILAHAPNMVLAKLSAVGALTEIWGGLLDVSEKIQSGWPRANRKPAQDIDSG